MISKFLRAATATLAVASVVSAQTYTDCDPTKRDGCPNPKAVGSQVVDIDFRKGGNAFFKELEGTKITYDPELGAVFSIKKETDAPTIASNKYIFFGQVDVTVRAARGTGIVTSFVLQSDDLDEIDWEWIGSDNYEVQTNYFSKGCTETYDRGGFSNVHDPINTFHTYTIRWTPEQLDWIIDGNVVRTLKNTGEKGCSGYPQSPMQIKLGTWVAGRKDAPEGTIQWAGGLANWKEAPFDGYYQSIRIQDFMGGAKEATEYQYTDRSGTWQSIRVVNDGKPAEISSEPTLPATTSTAKPSSTSTSSVSTTSATTFATVTSATSTVASSATASQVSISPSPTVNTPNAGVSPVPSDDSTGAAGRLALNVGNAVAMGVAAVCGYLLL